MPEIIQCSWCLRTAFYVLRYRHVQWHDYACELHERQHGHAYTVERLPNMGS